MSHFKSLFDHSVERFEHGGVQINDYVKIKTTDYKDCCPETKERLENFKNSGNNIKVVGVVNPTKAKEIVEVEIGEELASGIFPVKVAVPVEILEIVGYNQPPSIPDSWKRVDTSDQNGSPVETNKDYTNYMKTVDMIKTKKPEFNKV